MLGVVYLLWCGSAEQRAVQYAAQRQSRTGHRFGIIVEGNSFIVDTWG